MKAIVIDRFGEPDVFRPAELPTPQAGPGEIVIRVAATSVNPIDCRLRRGLHPQLAPELPAVLHGDVAGVVVEAGEGVSAFRAGDEVYAFAGGFKGMGGALAEYMALDAQLAAPKPKTLTMAEAAALPVVGLTAWQALIERARIQPGQSVLVHAAAGGVGHIGVQLARWKGADVYATASSLEKLELARRLGAKAAINYREKTVEQYVQEHTGGQGFDVVFDTVGKTNLDASLAAAKIHGTVVTASARSTHDLSPMHAKALSLHVVFVLLPLLTGTGRARLGEALGRLARLVDEGHVRPIVDPHTFTFAEAAEAHRFAESGQAIGKIGLTSSF
jgi:NADPH2:quinone reductase